MKKKEYSEEYIIAKQLSHDLQELYREISIIDKALAEMQIDKAEAEMGGEKASPLWKKWFRITKKQSTKQFFAEPEGYYLDKRISLSEAELVMLRGFKQGRIDEINEEIRKLSEKINEE